MLSTAYENKSQGRITISDEASHIELHEYGSATNFLQIFISSAVRSYIKISQDAQNRNKH